MKGAFNDAALPLQSCRLLFLIWQEELLVK